MVTAHSTIATLEQSMKNRFGTTEDMVIQHLEEDGKTVCLAIDAKGVYLTTPGRLGSRLADPNRYSAARFSAASRLTALGLDPEALFSENQHLIKTEGGDAKRVNPLKASKRGAKSA